MDWNDLRSKDPPFVPELDSETDAGYFDDFTNSEDMAKYKEVHDKQAALEGMADRGEKMNKSAFLGFTFRYAAIVRVPKAYCVLTDLTSQTPETGRTHQPSEAEPWGRRAVWHDLLAFMNVGTTGQAGVNRVIV